MRRRNSDGVRFDSKITVWRGRDPLWLSVWLGGMPWASFMCYWLTTRARWGCTGRITGRVPICHLPGQGGLCGGGRNGNRLRDEETRKFSDDGSVLTDAISKGDIDVLRRAWPFRRNLVEIPNSLLIG